MTTSQSDLGALVREVDEPRGEAANAGRVPPPKRKWRTRVLLPLAVFVLTGGLVVYAAGDALWPRTPVRVVPVLVKMDIEAQPAGTVVVQAPGWVEADPFAVGVSALADGVVEEMLVLEGERIEAGQVVARLVDDDARIALSEVEARLAQRQAALEAARAALAEAERNWEYPIELRRKLHTAEAELAEKRAELARWPAELRQAEAHLVYLAAEHERLKPLFERDVVSEIELVEARQARETQAALVDAIRRREPVLEAQIARLEAEVAAARESLELRIADTRALAEAKAGVAFAEAAVATAQAAVDDARLRLSRMEVRSPAGGVVMARLAEPGSKLLLQMDNPHSAQVVRLYDPNSLQVRVDVPLVDAAKVGVGQEAEVVVDVLPERVFRGQVTRVVHEADLQKNTLQVKVAIAEPSPALKPEMLARARFLAMEQPTPGDERAAEYLLVPKAAAVEHDGAEGVWVADQVERVARFVAAELRPRGAGDWVIVAEGLRPGDRVIIDPPAGLRDGQRITLQEVAAD